MGADFTSQVSQTLHDEHSATVALFERLDQLLGRHSRNNPPDVADPGVARLMRDLVTWVEAEIGRHFDFEEKELFAYLNRRGDEEIAAHLMEDHRVIRPVGARIGALARAAASQSLHEAQWDEFRRSGLQLCERIRAHVQEEEMALLPAVDDAIDPDTDARLYQEYADTL